MILEGSRTTGAFRIMGKVGTFQNWSQMLLTHFSPTEGCEQHCPELSLGSSRQQKSRQEALEGVSALGSAEDPKLAVM